MKKIIKLFVIIILILFVLGMLYIFDNLFGANIIKLNQITSGEKEEILKIINLNGIKDNIELEKIETPKVYKDIYYILYFSTNSESKEKFNDKKIDNLDINFSEIMEKNNIVQYRCTISNMGKSIEMLEQIRDRYGK